MVITNYHDDYLGRRSVSRGEDLEPYSIWTTHLYHGAYMQELSSTGGGYTQG